MNNAANVSYLCDMTADEYEAAFHGIDLPKEAQLYPGVRVSDVPEFIEAELTLLRGTKTSRIIEVVKDRLDRLLEIIQLSESQDK